ncbi:MAG: flagellin [Pirellulales bacterium]
MTRINTNVSSLVAQNTLGRTNASLQQALTRLSTGLRINTGKDDPAGLIASENLRSDITSIKKAISNTDRANQVIATADSSLGQVSSLLNDIRGLVTESANSGALSDDQISANQLQIDSSLAALNRIAQTTEFQGRRLLDGSLDFLTTAGANFARLSDLSIEQANLGASGQVSVAVTVSAAATQAQVDITGIPAATAAANASSNDDFVLTNTEVQAVFAFTFDTTVAASITITAVNGGAAEGADGNGINIVLVEDATVAGGVNAAASGYVDATNTLTIAANFASGTVTDTEVAAGIQAINGASSTFTAVAAPGATNLAAADIGTYVPTYTTDGRDAGSSTIEVTADTAGAAANGVTVTLIEDNTITNNTAEAAIVGGNIEVRVRGTVTKNAIATAIDGLTGYSAAVTASSGDANYNQTLDTPPAAATLTGGLDATGGLATDVVFQLGGADGVEIFTFQAGSSVAQLADTISAFSDATGVAATVNGTTLELSSSAYGSDAFVDIQLLEESVGGTFTTAIGSGARSEGVDVQATVNGIQALGSGNEITLSTATLALNTSIEAGFTGTVNFDITGGGALFQLGPDVVANQQARFGITSVNTAKLGGVSGKLFELKSGEAASIKNDPTTAFRIVDEAINKVTSLRGRLGSFQRTTLETNKNALGDTLVNLTDAESTIRDADFAAETAALTRAQILVQSGTTVLAIANSNPQNVLALLQ